jgi:hypothetical protein
LSGRGLDGPRDCGRFLLDAVGAFTSDQLRIDCQPSRMDLPEDIRTLVEEAWQQALEDASSRGARLYDGRLARLMDYQWSANQLELTLGEVGFKDFVGTNLANPHLRYSHGHEVLANALGVSSSLVTDDGFLVLCRRSPRVYFHTGRLHPLGGIVEYADGSDRADPFETIREEIREEAALDEQELAEVVCIGLVRDKRIVQPELIFEMTVRVQMNELLQRCRQAPDGGEHAEIVPVRDHPSAITSFIERNSDDLTGVGLATLLLHGLYRWGTGWFTKTRGYLRGVI